MQAMVSPKIEAVVINLIQREGSRVPADSSVPD